MMAHTYMYMVAAQCVTEAFSTTHVRVQCMNRGLWSADGCLVVIAQW